MTETESESESEAESETESEAEPETTRLPSRPGRPLCSLLPHHFDYARRVYDRSLEVVGTEGVLQWRFQDNFVQCYDAKSRGWVVLSESKQHDFNAMYVAEMRHFLDVVSLGAAPEQDGLRGRQVVELALAAKQSNSEGRAVSLAKALGQGPKVSKANTCSLRRTPRRS